MNGDVGDVQLVGDFPQAHVPGHPGAVADDEAARHLVLLHLVEERAARPRHRERRALDRQDVVEIERPHPLN